MDVKKIYDIKTIDTLLFSGVVVILCELLRFFQIVDPLFVGILLLFLAGVLAFIGYERNKV